MAESVPVMCPACGREHRYCAPTFPCACGAPLSPSVLAGADPLHVLHRSWDESWVRVRCADCGRADHWPQPEFDCSCGALVRLPLDGGPDGRLTADGPGADDAAPPDRPDETDAEADPGSAAPPPGVRRLAPRRGAPEPAGQASPAAARPPFQPVTIRTARDALTAAGQYLRWLGFTQVRLAGDRTANGIDLRGDGLVAQVDPATLPTPLREVECLWLNCVHEDTIGAFFSLAGYAYEARVRADQLGVPLFVMDLTGTPQPVNDAADELIRRGPHPPPA